MRGEVESLDGAWSVDHVAGLIEGEVLSLETDARGREVEVVRPRATAYEMRCRVLDGHAPLDTLLDSVQLRTAIVGIEDREVRAFMVASVALGACRYWQAEDYVIEAGLRTSNRSGKRLFERGVHLICQHERTRRRQLRRIRASGGVSEGPACWKCMKEPVLRIGDACNACAVKPEPRVGAKAKPVEEMTLTELIATQEEPVKPDGTIAYNRIIPGGAYYEKMVAPGGRDPSEDDSRIQSAGRRGPVA